ncbi:MAG: hypothetical protein KGK18_16735 [Burkholderiales bacterium]|nr:hypothetical protein [Burkholderiales bacterium]
MTGVTHVGYTMALPARLLTDAYLAAVAGSATLRMVMFGKDFERFDSLVRLRLVAARH